MQDDHTQPPRSAKATAHLARVRDNQRRSRARRKEYLTELEEKFRRCEQAGVEASAEMQHAARQVLEENARLRAFLKEKGHSDQELDTFTSKAACGIDDLSLNHVKTDDSTMSNAVQGLENLLKSKSSCGSSSASRTRSQSRSPTASDGGSSEYPFQRTVSTLLSAPPMTQGSYRQTTPTASRAQMQPGRQPSFPLPQRHGFQQSVQQQLQPSSEISSSGMHDPPTIGDILKEDPSYSYAGSNYPSYIGFITSLSDAIELSSQHGNQEMRPPRRDLAQRPSHVRLPMSQPASTYTSGVPMSSSQTSYAYEQPMPEPIRSSSMSSTTPRMYDPSPLQNSLPSPSSYFIGANMDTHQIDDFSDLLLDPQLQAQFLRGLGEQQSNTTYMQASSSSQQTNPNSSVSASIEEDLQWPTDSDHRETRLW